MDVDGELQAAGGGGEQPPAEDPLAALPPEMREQPEGECDPAVQARVANWLHLQRTRGKYINQEIRKSRWVLPGCRRAACTTHYNACISCLLLPASR